MRAFLITILAIAILLLAGAWVYLLINGAPESVEDLRDQLFGGTTLPTPEPITETTPTIAEPDDRLATNVPLLQVSERAVAGAGLHRIASSSVLRYMEKGTGHIYELDVDTGVSTRISNTTIPGAARAIWSPQGDRLIILTDTQGGPGTISLGTLATTTDGVLLSLSPLTDDTENIAFSQDGTTLFYTRPASDGKTELSALALKTNTVKRAGVVPFSESTMLWDLWGSDEHYVYTRPAAGYRGYLYRIGDRSLEKIDEGETLVAVRADRATMLINKSGQSGETSTRIDLGTNAGDFLSIPVVREKCASGSSVWCAASEEAGGSFPVPWYQGLVSYSDRIYRVDPETGAQASLELETYARMPIDVTDLSAGMEGRLIFINKRDDTLWLANPALISS
jgi:dipeptidyl aminopeptidase/acylaminoacyl peptidase